MKSITTYIPYVLCLLLFFAGRMSAPDNSKEVSKIFEQERLKDREAIIRNKKIITRLQADSAEIQGERISDSLFYAGALESNKQAYSVLKRKYNEINLNRASVAQLDSLVGVLFPD